jgi:hypothetical protein
MELIKQGKLQKQGANAQPAIFSFSKEAAPFGIFSELLESRDRETPRAAPILD